MNEPTIGKKRASGALVSVSINVNRTLVNTEDGWKAVGAGVVTLLITRGNVQDAIGAMNKQASGKEVFKVINYPPLINLITQMGTILQEEHARLGKE